MAVAQLNGEVTQVLTSEPETTMQTPTITGETVTTQNSTQTNKITITSKSKLIRR